MGQAMIKEMRKKRCLQEPSAHLNQPLDISGYLLLMICYILQILQRNHWFLEGFFLSDHTENSALQKPADTREK